MKAKTEEQQSHGDTKLDTECDSRGKRVNSHDTSEDAGVGRKTSEVVVLDGSGTNVCRGKNHSKDGRKHCRNIRKRGSRINSNDDNKESSDYAKIWLRVQNA